MSEKSGKKRKVIDMSDKYNKIISKTKELVKMIIDERAAAFALEVFETTGHNLTYAIQAYDGVFWDLIAELIEVNKSKRWVLMYMMIKQFNIDVPSEVLENIIESIKRAGISLEEIEGTMEQAKSEIEHQNTDKTIEKKQPLNDNVMFI